MFLQSVLSKHNPNGECCWQSRWHCYCYQVKGTNYNVWWMFSCLYLNVKNTDEIKNLAITFTVYKRYVKKLKTSYQKILNFFGILNWKIKKYYNLSNNRSSLDINLTNISTFILNIEFCLTYLQVFYIKLLKSSRTLQKLPKYPQFKILSLPLRYKHNL